MSTSVFDLAVIGGGINGCGIARDAQGRGLSVFLAEKGDLAGGTSSASTKLIHGGLRYLEHYEFRLVRESLKEREVLWALAPHIIHPLRFVLPHSKGLRPAWLVRLGLFLYDHLGGRERLPGTRRIDLRRDEAGQPLKGGFETGFEYSDCWVDDARLVVLNARDAADRGAAIHTRTEVISAERHGNLWRIDLKDTRSDETSAISAHALVNATGPWVGGVLADRIENDSPFRVRMVKGSHILVPRLFDHDRAYIFQNPDQRIVFAIPFETDFTLVGTTDVDYRGRPEEVQADADEIAYLCNAASDYFTQSVSPDDVVWTYSGVRPLFDDGSHRAQTATRDYVLELDHPDGQAPLLNIFGGKLTGYRHLAEHALDKLSDAFPDLSPDWTHDVSLPGGNFPVDGRGALDAELHARYPELPHDLLHRLARTYGTQTCTVLGKAQTEANLGHHFGAGLYAREVDYLRHHEWAVTADDILWRRTKLGLRLDGAGRAELEQWLAHQDQKAHEIELNLKEA